MPIKPDPVPSQPLITNAISAPMMFQRVGRISRLPIQPCAVPARHEDKHSALDEHCSPRAVAFLRDYYGVAASAASAVASPAPVAFAPHETVVVAPLGVKIVRLPAGI